MKNTFSWQKNWLLYAIAWLMLTLFSSILQAKVVQTISAANFSKLEQVQLLIERKKYTEAEKILAELGRKKRLNNYTRAQIANYTAYLNYDQEKYAQALTEYLKVVKNPQGIPDGVFNQTLYTIAQLYFQQEDYKNSLKYARQWFTATKNPPADAYLLIGQAHYMLKEYNEALELINTGVAMVEQENKKPKENWLLLLRAIYYDKNDYKKMLPVVRKLLKLYPKADYMLALVGVYAELGDQDKMITILEALYDEKLLVGKGKQIINLASLYLVKNAPYKAAVILDREIKNGEIDKTETNYLLLAQAFMLAKEFEKSLEPMQQAAALSNNPKYYFDLGQSYSLLNRLQDAENSYRKALSLPKNKSLKSRETVEIALGVNLIEQKKYNEGEKVFKSILRHNSTSKAAKQWMVYIKAEKQRIQQLDRAIN